MADIIERLRIESQREPNKPIWRDAIDEIEALLAEVAELRAARIAYASEFPATKDGGPDTDNIHANIRALKARAEQLKETLREAKEKMLAQVKWVACDCGCGGDKPADAVSVAWLRASTLLHEQEEGK